MIVPLVLHNAGSSDKRFKFAFEYEIIRKSYVMRETINESAEALVCGAMCVVQGRSTLASFYRRLLHSSSLYYAQLVLGACILPCLFLAVEPSSFVIFNGLSYQGGVSETLFVFFCCKMYASKCAGIKIQQSPSHTYF